MLSSDARAITIGHFIAETHRVIVERATRLVAGAQPASRRDTVELPRLIDAAREVAATAKWTPAFWMIDKCKAEFNAIRACKSLLNLFSLRSPYLIPTLNKTQRSGDHDAVIRLCQFHVIQALVRWETDGEKRSGESPSLSQAAHVAILHFFRKIQRARTMEELEVRKAAFWLDLDSVLSRYISDEAKAARQRDRLHDYFEKYWFTDFWIRMHFIFSPPPHLLNARSVIASMLHRHWPSSWSDSRWDMEYEQLD
jgi:hypothetical protein